ncbi:MAG: DUF87 domain-containing protein [Phycisphaerales bacterium]|nr:DUF87 domain-containing protein [Phycisphaerales bacterium]
MLPSPLPDYEKLGVFYLGRHYDLDGRKRLDDLVLYDSRDLVTHAVCVGMTGSGKTGLCIGLIEEAAIDGVPVIVIDPKGDLANLLLTFPELRPEDFLPWANPDEARRKGLSREAFAEQQAALWGKGLAEWAQDGARIQRLRDAADFAVYTPGSSAGLGVSILNSFACPPREIMDDRDLLRDRIATTVTSLLSLAGVSGDPMRSREHILLSTILGQAWDQGHDLDLAALVQQVQQPAVARVGVMELDSFFPPKDRFELAMSLNSLLASPGFGAWMEGQPLDIGALLHTPEGKPRVSIFSIAHLGEAERMFFVSLLLTQFVGWMRSQSGTTSLRAMLYMDEIAGYCPPVANPPSKGPLLTLMKQARAFGVGVVLATQNPVDLDYKGLSNAGTWFIGRLQTEQDKARVLDGLQGAAGSAGGAFDRERLNAILSKLGSRVFLMSNVHDETPTVFETRWALSYLCGPLTRAQIKALTDERRALEAAAMPERRSAARPDPQPASQPVPRPAPSTSAPASEPSVATEATRPVVPPDVPCYYLPIRSYQANATLEYRPYLLGLARAHVRDTKLDVETDLDGNRLAPFTSGPVVIEWERSEPIAVRESELREDPEEAAPYAELPAAATVAKSFTGWKRDLADVLVRQLRVDLYRCESLDVVSRPGEREGEFRARLQLVARERRDDAVARLRAKFAPKLQTLQDRLQRAQDAVEVQKAQARDAKVSTAVSFGTAVLGAIFGRKKVGVGTVSRAGTAARGVSRSMREGDDVARAMEKASSVKAQLAELQSELQAQIDAIAERMDPLTEPLDSVTLRPKKSAVKVSAVVLAWAPVWVGANGKATGGWR